MTKTLSDKKLSRLENFYLMTNIKGALTVILVCFHFLTTSLISNLISVDWVSPIISLIGPFIILLDCTVPIFIIITGYYAKDLDSCRNNAFTTALIPYILLQTFSMLYFGLIDGTGIYWDLFNPHYQIWYLLSMFFWFMTMKDIVKIKGGFWIMFAASLLVGVVLEFKYFTFDSSMDVYMSLFHTIAYYPYIMIGYYLKPEHIDKVRNIKLRYGVLIGVLYLVMNIVFFYWYITDDSILKSSIHLLTATKDYVYYLTDTSTGVVRGLSSYTAVAIVGILFRLYQYLLVGMLSVLAIRFFPKKKVPFLTKVGAAALTVYSLHAFVAIPLGSLFASWNVYLQVGFVAVGTFALSWIFSLDIIHKSYTKFLLMVGDKITKKPQKTEK